MEIISHSLSETGELAAQIVTDLEEKRRGGKVAMVVALQGDLGSGKTSFTQAVARVLGIKERVTSPTFVIMKTYQWQGFPLPKSKGNPFSPWRRLVHIDCYRLEGPADLLHLGWNEIIADRHNLILIEWPERVGNLLTTPTLKIKFEVMGENVRKIIYG
ncbi:MAG: tRNA (adenosine(37)-N6)-threonylcarbamoyltransferase complex ATPase subunit type 1 TsaE [Patescibacteria group bacterium]